MPLPSREICGITVPDTLLVARAMEAARTVSEAVTKAYAGTGRFEVEGADLARTLSREHGAGDRRAQLIWYCVALNATLSLSPHAEREVAICTAGAGIDYAGFLSEQIPKETTASIVATFPRLEMKQQLKECLSRIARERPQTTHENFLRDFGERFVPGYKPPISTVDLLANAPFDE